MDHSIQRSLNDKLYEKRKVGALEYVIHFISFHSPPPNDKTGSDPG